jgi:hypothetical protein
MPCCCRVREEVVISSATILVRLVVAALALSGAVAQAAEADFLKTFSGNWGGNGSVRIRTAMPSMRVNCKLASTVSATSMSLVGQCTSLTIFSRPLSATVTTNGKRYTGTYVGSRTGPATLSGTRSGDALDLEIRWAKNINGDRSAQLRIEKIGDDKMRMTTVDKDPLTGKSVVTSQIDLRRL